MPFSWLEAASPWPSRLSAPATRSKNPAGSRIPLYRCSPRSARSDRGDRRSQGLDLALPDPAGSCPMRPNRSDGRVCVVDARRGDAPASRGGFSTRRAARLQEPPRVLSRPAFGLETFPSILAATAAAAALHPDSRSRFRGTSSSRLRGHGSPVAALRETGPLSLTALASLRSSGVAPRMGLRRRSGAWWVLPLVPRASAGGSAILRPLSGRAQTRRRSGGGEQTP